MRTRALNLQPNRAKRGDKWQELPQPVVLSLLTFVRALAPEKIRIVGGGCDCFIPPFAIAGNNKRLHAWNRVAATSAHTTKRSMTSRMQTQ